MLTVGLFPNYGADLSGLGGMACRVLIDSHDLPWSKRTQPIHNGTKHKLVVTYSELNESKMSKMQYHFILKFKCLLYVALLLYANIHNSGLVKIKRCSTESNCRM